MGNEVVFLNDSCIIETRPDGSFDLTLPSGRHVRGRAKDQTAAKTAAHAEHDRYVLGQWSKGSPVAGGVFRVPLA